MIMKQLWGADKRKTSSKYRIWETEWWGEYVGLVEGARNAEISLRPTREGMTRSLIDVHLT